ncbi:hypothetical protein ACLIR7_03280 [Nitratireductor aquimarinus]|uniref:hypothetical protein n=1 Tax=Nitratireductor aquimarinus TaxID=889300 RepID=UPI00398F4204
MVEKSGQWISAVATVFAALAAAWSAYSSNAIASQVQAASAERVALLEKAQTDRRLDIEMVKLALNILGGQISDETHQSRKFAIRLLGKYSGVDIDQASENDWLQSGKVAFKDVASGLSPGGWRSDAEVYRLEELLPLIRQQTVVPPSKGGTEPVPMPVVPFSPTENQ